MATSPFANVVLAPGAYSYLSADLSLDDAGSEVDDGADDNTIVISNKQLLVLFNSTGGALDLVITTVATRFGRVASTAQETYSIPAGETHIIGPLVREGFADASNLCTVQASAAGLRMAVVTLPVAVP